QRHRPPAVPPPHFLILAALATCESQHKDTSLCPDLCFCLFSATGEEVECSNNSRTHFPVQNLSPNTTRLSIQLSNLSSITADHLSAVPLLKYLQLYHNNLTSLSADLLKGVPNLHTLDLTGNRLVRLPPDIFSQASLSLTSLELSGNRLSGVPTALLHRLPNLNQLQSFPSGLLDDTLPSFQIVLSGNPWVCDERLEYLWRWLIVHYQNNTYPTELCYTEGILPTKVTDHIWCTTKCLQMVTPGISKEKFTAGFSELSIFLCGFAIEAMVISQVCFQKNTTAPNDMLFNPRRRKKKSVFFLQLPLFASNILTSALLNHYVNISLQ
uniref:LRRCT domain-containing protein n=1 Tax=Mola mola TaxID=94237 RepID=A0A3Q3VXT4_MOLML